MGTFAEVGFKGTRKEYFLSPELDLQIGDRVIVEADRGEDLGMILALGSVAEKKCATAATAAPPSSHQTERRKILRIAGEADTRFLQEIREDEHRVRTETRALVQKLGLRMKVAEAEW